MEFVMLHDVLPDVAEQETRSLIILQDNGIKGVPAGQYLFHEMYCNGRDCDCRRVFFYVTSLRRNNLVAVVSWGWETPAFYAKWLYMYNDLAMGAKCKGPFLEPSNPQTALAPAILALTNNVLLQDALFVDRIKRHYHLFKEKIGAKLARKRTRNSSKSTQSNGGRKRIGRPNK